jgi:hypothetical protein
MGMIDFYRPQPALVCPQCGQSPGDWTGTEGFCLLYVWQQGHAAPVEQIWDSEVIRFTRDDAPDGRLPARFQICGTCCCKSSFEAVGWTEDGVWVRTEVLNETNAIPTRFESEREFRKRLEALARHPGHARE